MYTITPISAFSDNYIWLIVNTQNNHAVVVDPGEAEPVLAILNKQAISLKAILVTHHHFDHCHGVGKIIKAYPVPVYAPKYEAIAYTSDPVHEGDNIMINELNLHFSIVDIPAHTHGHIAYYTSEWLFCGDTLFTGGCGRLFEGTAEQMLASLTKICQLPEQTWVYCGHEYTQNNLRFAAAVEPNNKALQQRIIDTDAKRAQNLPTVPATLALEKSTNPFLRCHFDTVHRAAERHVGHKLDNVVDVFQVIRDWKDTF